MYFFSVFFTASVDENRIILAMSPLPENVIEENVILVLEVTASSERSSASAIVTLEIIKNDTTTPLFEKAVYAGTYDSESGLDLDQIELVQGYDNTVEITLIGGNKLYYAYILDV